VHGAMLNSSSRCASVLLFVRGRSARLPGREARLLAQSASAAASRPQNAGAQRRPVPRKALLLRAPAGAARLRRMAREESEFLHAGDGQKPVNGPITRTCEAIRRGVPGRAKSVGGLRPRDGCGMITAAGLIGGGEARSKQGGLECSDM